MTCYIKKNPAKAYWKRKCNNACPKEIKAIYYSIFHSCTPYQLLICRAVYPIDLQNHYTTANQRFVLCLYYFFARSLITSPATISPTTDGTNAVEPGISRRTVHFLAVPGGQMQS